MEFDEILRKCGNSNRYQYLLLGLYSFLMFISAMHYFSQNVISFVPEHWCYHEQLENLSFSQIAEIYNKLEKPSCTKLATVDLSGGNSTVSADLCEHWIYNYDFGFRSMNTEVRMQHIINNYIIKTYLILTLWILRSLTGSVMMLIKHPLDSHYFLEVLFSVRWSLVCWEIKSEESRLWF